MIYELKINEDNVKLGNEYYKNVGNESSSRNLI